MGGDSKMLLKHLVKHGGRVTKLHSEHDFIGHTFEFGDTTPKGIAIVAQPKARLRKKGKSYTIYGYYNGPI